MVIFMKIQFVQRGEKKKAKQWETTVNQSTDLTGCDGRHHHACSLVKNTVKDDSSDQISFSTNL